MVCILAGTNLKAQEYVAPQLEFVCELKVTIDSEMNCWVNYPW